MTDHIASGDRFHPRCSIREVNSVSALGLAHLGDAVYEILVRSMLVMEGRTTGAHLHQDTTALVCAPAQALAAGQAVSAADRRGTGLFSPGPKCRGKTYPQKRDTHPILQGNSSGGLVWRAVSAGTARSIVPAF